MTDWSQYLIDPTYGAAGDRQVRLADRPGSLNGATVGLLDNGKASGSIVLEQVARRLAEEFALSGVRLYTKVDAGLTVTVAEIDDISAACDVVITAVGDCGSCSAATVADGILLERAGVPTASICTEAFRLSGDSMAVVYGFPDFEYVRVEHPVASLSADEIDKRVESAMPRILGILLGEQS